jgi:hypothetical protein
LAIRKNPFVFLAETIWIRLSLLVFLEIARPLRNHMDSDGIRPKLAAANVLGSSSHEVQACFDDHAEALGFQSERRGLFTGYKVADLRPDYYLRLSAGRGINISLVRPNKKENRVLFFQKVYIEWSLFPQTQLCECILSSFIRLLRHRSGIQSCLRSLQGHPITRFTKG